MFDGWYLETELGVWHTCMFFFSKNVAPSCKQCKDFKQFNYHQFKALQIYIYILYPNA